MTEPQTEAGREWWRVWTLSEERDAILAIEREATRAVLDRLAAAVKGLDHYPGHVMRPPNAERWLDRAAVLALITAEQEAIRD